jgi:hypothetical protein
MKNVLVQVRVGVFADDDAEFIARRMIADVLASRSAYWHDRTFIAENDISIRAVEEAG